MSGANLQAIVVEQPTKERKVMTQCPGENRRG
ncbi:hypothetical protein M6B38_346095 [Iris pallida]|uniref:Uncharacterized protein n=1 Tax=Iris pallida TaxID=29817 RepID=A0AAX6GUX2_IRIPA|nr:hypothetical protein M6B38_346095 [Iris pallida]